MTQEEKQLLLQDLCARLPYGVVCHTEKGDGHLCSINQTIFGTEYGLNISPVKRDYFNDSEQDEVVIKPYLRPMSSMTEEEKKDLLVTIVGNEGAEYFQVLSDGTIDSIDDIIQDQTNFNMHWVIFSKDTVTLYHDWLNARHFDFRGLIEKGLAIEVTEENNPYKGTVY